MFLLANRTSSISTYNQIFHFYCALSSREKKLLFRPHFEIIIIILFFILLLLLISVSLEIVSLNNIWPSESYFLKLELLRSRTLYKNHSSSYEELFDLNLISRSTIVELVWKELQICHSLYSPTLCVRKIIHNIHTWPICFASSSWWIKFWFNFRFQVRFKQFLGSHLLSSGSKLFIKKFLILKKNSPFFVVVANRLIMSQNDAF